jgi:N-acetylglucosaminyldiphosphoundecaprenol N-acetyl-beta-D-mannosaminyltransferase
MDMKEKNSRKQVTILGVKVDSTTKMGVLREIQSKLKTSGKFFIVTPNPEQVLVAREDEQYKDILDSADISIPDGVGLVAASKFISLPRPKNFVKRAFVLFAQGLGVGFSILFDRIWLETELKLVKGREIFIELIKLANKKGWRVVLVGDSNKSAQKAARKLKENFIKLDIVGFTGPSLKDSGKSKTGEDRKVENSVIQKINKEKPEILFIGFRAPVQEKWLYRWYEKMDFKCAMVVGGTFDYVSGKKPLPPKWIEDINLEWFWRLAKGDQKVKRVFKAFPKFAWSIYWEKFVKNA